MNWGISRIGLRLLGGGAMLTVACSGGESAGKDAELGTAWTWVAPKSCAARGGSVNDVATFDGTKALWSVKPVVDEQRVFVALHPDDGADVDVVSVPLSCGKPSVLSRRKGQITAGFAYEDGDLYFVESNRLMALSVATGAARAVADTAPGGGAGGQVPYIAVRKGTVYVADVDGSVWKVSAKGGDTVTLASGSEAPGAIAVDAQSVYWASLAPTTYDGVQHQLGKVQSVALDGGAVTLIATAQEAPDGIVVAGSTLYWANAGTFGVDAPAGPGEIVTAELPASPRTVLANEDNPASLQRAGDTLYWEDAAKVSNSIVALPSDQATPTTLSAATPGNTFYSGLVASDAALYWFRLEQEDGDTVHNVTTLVRWVLPAR